MAWIFGLVAVAAVAAGDAAHAQQAKAPVPRGFDALLRGVCDDAPGARAAAAREMGALWPDGARGVPALRELLRDEDESVRRAGGEALVALGRRSIAPLGSLFSAVVPGGGPPARDRAAEYLAGSVRMCIQLGLAATPGELGAAFAQAESPEETKAALLALAALADRVLVFRRPFVHPEDLAAGRLMDRKAPEPWSAVLALHGAAYAREIGFAPPAAPVEAPDSWVRGLQAESPEVRFVAARLVSITGRAGPKTVAAIRAAAAAASAPGAEVPDWLRSALWEALGAAIDPATADAAAFAAPGGMWDRASFAEGVCRQAGLDAAVRLLAVPDARSAAARRIALGPVTPAACEPALRSILAAGDRPDPFAAYALGRLGRRDADLVRRIDVGVRRALDAKPVDIEAAMNGAIAAWWIDPSEADRAARIDAVRRAAPHPLTEDVVVAWGHFGADAAPIVARLAPETPAGILATREWRWYAAALGPAAKDLARDLAAASRADPAPAPIPGESTHPGYEAPIDWMLDESRAAALTALARVGPAAASVLRDVEALRSDPSPRIAVLAARASRAIRAK